MGRAGTWGSCPLKKSQLRICGDRKAKKIRECLAIEEKIRIRINLSQKDNDRRWDLKGNRVKWAETGLGSFWSISRQFEF